MRISQKLEYALRAMAQLAKSGHTITRLDEIAQREAVSSNFLVQILNDLRRAGLVLSKRGKMGGYALAKEAEEISVYDIVEAIEPTLVNEDIIPEGESGTKVATVWASLSDHFTEELKKRKLTELSNNSDNHMFYI